MAPRSVPAAEQSPSTGAPAWQWHVDVPLVGPVGWPPTGSAAFLVVVCGLAAVEVVSWPLALVVGVGHVLARDHDHRVFQEIGQGLEVA